MVCVAITYYSRPGSSGVSLLMVLVSVCIASMVSRYCVIVSSMLCWIFLASSLLKARVRSAFSYAQLARVFYLSRSSLTTGLYVSSAS